MKLAIHVLLLLLPRFCSSQQDTVDSLKRLLPLATTDSARYNLWFQIGYGYSAINYDSALFYYDQCLHLARKNGKALNEAFALSRKGFVFDRMQRLTEAFQVLTAALLLAEDRQNETKFWNIRRQVVNDRDFRLRALANIHNGLGLLMRDVDKIDQAVFHYREARKLWEAVGSATNVGTINANLAVLYWKTLNEPDSALVLAKAAERIFLKEGDEIILGGVYTIIGASYAAKHNDPLAVTYLHQAMALNKGYDKQDMLAATYRELTKFYLSEKKADSSLYYAQKAAGIHLSVHPMDLGDDYQNLAKSYELNNEQDSAYKYQGIALATYDSLYQSRMKGLTGFQQLSFEQQQQLQQMEAEKIATRNRNRMYALLLGTGVVLLAGFFLYHNNRQQKRANDQIQKAYRELKATQAQLIQSEKMASLGELTAGIAHEIQNPLNFVNNFSAVNIELLSEMKEEIEKGNLSEVKIIAGDLEANEEKIIHHGQRADSIVKGMLQHARQSAGEKQPTNINELADEYLRLSYQGMRAKVKTFNASLITSYDDTIGEATVVAQDIGRVLLNLFNNAFYALDQKKAQLDGRYEPVVSVTTKRESDYITITVKDNGAGMSPKVVDKVFQPFFTTKPTGEGTGLGLSLSYDIITKGHGGAFSVQSKEGEGSEFVVRLPA